VIISHQQFTNELLFHEFVHAEQYRPLGIARFAELYVCGFLAGGSYEAIPLEVSAYTRENGDLSAIRATCFLWRQRSRNALLGWHSNRLGSQSAC
jgi:hypothetical protein